MINQYRVRQRKITSLECSTFYDYYIEQRRFKRIGINYKFFWKEVIDESKTQMIDMSGNVSEYPYRFNTEQEAKDFIVNELIGKDQWRDDIINKILN